MADVFDYLKWRGDLRFEAVPLCEVDVLIFCELSYIFFDGIVPEWYDMDGITLKRAGERFFDNNKNKKIVLGEIVPDEIVDLLRDAMECDRFANVTLNAFVNIVDDLSIEQFSAVTFEISDEVSVVTFRGTDDSIVGWKEDLMMSFMTPVPAQNRATEYLIKIAEAKDCSLVIAGHSKGGNLALWAALTATNSIKHRISAVYNFDGPGFLSEVFGGSDYSELQDRIDSIVPECSVVGMLLNHDANYRVVTSSAKGIAQHNALTWDVLGGKFVRTVDLDPEYRRINAVISRWIDSMNSEARKAFIDAFFAILESTNSKTVTDLSANRAGVLKALSEADPETRDALSGGWKFLVGEGRATLSELLRKPPDAEKKPRTPKTSSKQGTVQQVRHLPQNSTRVVKRAPITQKKNASKRSVPDKKRVAYRHCKRRLSPIEKVQLVMREIIEELICDMKTVAKPTTKRY